MAQVEYRHSLRGVVGDKVYFKRADEYFARIRVNNVKASNEESAVARRLQFGAIGKLARAMKYVTIVGFPGRPKRETATNAFVRLNYNCCTVDDVATEAVTIDYPGLVFADGVLEAPRVTASFEEAGHSLSFSVTAASRTYGGCMPTDKVYTVVVDEERNRAVLEELGTRGEGGIKTVDLDDTWKKEKLHVYVFCTDEKGKEASPSLHLTLA